MKDTKIINSRLYRYENEKVDGENVLSFLGIPYARAERFGIPEEIRDYWTVPVNSGIGMCFPQNRVPPLINLFVKNPMMRKEILTDTDKTDENAFVLNIWTSDTEGKKPVLVFIHGGGFTYGSGTTPLYNGKYLAAKGIVVVTINYRLSAPGFMPVILDGKLSANRGFLDQQCALKWVRKNISAFGGDDQNITLMGQSAGGLSVSMHMFNEESSAQFDKLIVCSAGANKCMDLEKAAKVAEAFVKRNRLASSEELLTLPWKKIVRLKMPLDILATPTIDGVFLKEDAVTMMKNGNFDAKPVMLGTTGDELKMIDNKSWYKALGIEKSEEKFRKKYLSNYGPEALKLADGLRKSSKSLTDLQFKMMEMFFHVGALRNLRLYSAKTACYGYRMNFVPNIWNGMRGAYHCAELPFIFGTIRDICRPTTKENLVQMEVIQSDWIAFIRDGSLPNRETFGERGKISLYEGQKVQLVDFPQRALIEELEDSGVFEKLMSSFMKGRDNNFIA